MKKREWKKDGFSFRWLDWFCLCPISQIWLWMNYGRRKSSLWVFQHFIFLIIFFSQFRVITVSPDITPRGWLGSKCQLTNSCDYSPLRLCRSQLCRNLDILKQFLFPWPKLFSVSLKIHMCPCQNCSERPPEEKTGKGRIVTDKSAEFSVTSTWQPSQSKDWTELN